MPVKRTLFQTPTRPIKRRRVTKKKAPPMRVPRSLMPEVKQIQNVSLTSSTNYAMKSIEQMVTRGDDQDEFIGSRFRLLRLRVRYDFSSLTLSEGVRISVFIPKDPGAYTTLGNHVDNWDKYDKTVLYDLQLPNDPSVLAGTFDVVGPFNIEMDRLGTSCKKNNITVYVHSASNGASLANPGNCAVSLYYTDA